MIDDSGCGSQPLGERSRVANITLVIGDHSAVGAERDIAQLDRANASYGRSEPEGQQLEGYRSLQRFDWLRRIGDDDKTVGCARYDFLAGVRRSAPFDEPAVRGNLVGAVDDNIETLDLAKRLDPDP